MVLKEDFKSIVRESLGETAADALLRSLGCPDGSVDASADGPVTSVRLNPMKRPVFSRAERDAQECSGYAAPLHYTEEIPWVPDGLYLDRRTNFTLDPLLHAGAYYVQDASSMFPALLKDIVMQPEPARVLDLCAAPGGKSTHLISLLSSSRTHVPMIVVNEPVKKRVPPLTDNIARWGASNVLVTSRFAKDFQSLGEGFFDVILADVPCSGEGMFRKSADAVDGWSLSAVHDSARLQREIISDIWPVLSDGGVLIYSTCTYNRFENADNVRFIASELGAELLSLPESLTEKVPGLLKIGTDAGPGYQFVPGLVKGEGQFFALLRKNSGGRSDSIVCRKAGKKGGKSSFGGLKTSGPLSPGHEFYLRENRIYAVPSAIAGDMVRAASVLGAVMCGICVGELKGRDLIPDADLALSCMVYDLLGDGRCAERPGCVSGGIVSEFSNGASLRFSVADADRDTALKFLARQNIAPESLSSPCHDGSAGTLPKGYVLISYRGFPLGFVKNLGNRCNNLHPNGRRILHL